MYVIASEKQLVGKKIVVGGGEFTTKESHRPGKADHETKQRGTKKLCCIGQIGSRHKPGLVAEVRKETLKGEESSKQEVGGGGKN